MSGQETFSADQTIQGHQPGPVSGSTNVPEPRKPYGCGGCDSRWSGVSRCHCSRCHHTFAGAALFDKHQHLRNDVGYCDDPSAMTNSKTGAQLMFLDDAGIWSSVEEPTQRKAPVRRRGGATA